MCVLRGLLVVPACESVACSAPELSCFVFTITALVRWSRTGPHGRAVCRTGGKFDICSELHTYYSTTIPTARPDRRGAGRLGK